MNLLNCVIHCTTYTAKAMSYTHGKLMLNVW